MCFSLSAGEKLSFTVSFEKISDQEFCICYFSALKLCAQIYLLLSMCKISIHQNIHLIDKS